MLIAILLSFAILSLASELKPKSTASWPIEAEWLLLPANPSPNYGARDRNFEIVPVLRLAPVVPVIVDQIAVRTGKYVKEGDVIMSVLVRRNANAHLELYDVVAPLSGVVGAVHVQEGGLVLAGKPLMDLIEQELHARPIPFEPEPMPQPINPGYIKPPYYNQRPQGYGNIGNSRGDGSGESTDLNMFP